MNEIKQFAHIFDVSKYDASNYNELIDQIEFDIVSKLPIVELPLKHTISPRMYSREIFLPAGTLLTSKLHKESHQFILMSGSMVVTDETGTYKIKAPYHGTTMPGSVRFGIALEDSSWITFHCTDLVEDKEYTTEEMVDLIKKIEDELVEDRHNKLLNT